MKKYLSLAALLGLIAFVSVSYLAQAQNEAADHAQPPTAEVMESIENSSIEAVLPDVARFMQNAEECQTILAAEAEGIESDITQAQHDAAFTACMMDRGHSEEEVRTRYFDNEPAVPVVE
jgi:Na+-translocating ferredoxin:NAD+ oxidoreductase RnfG subunit